MKLYKIMLTGMAALAGVVGLGLGGKELYDSGLEHGLKGGFEKGVQEGRAQMESAVIINLRDRIGALRRDINLNKNYTQNPSELEIKALEAKENELFDLWAQLYRSGDEFFVSWYESLERSRSN